MDSVFYGRFDRHAHGDGLKGLSTHYCPGCGHGLIHKYIAESIDELGVQDRTVAISPVGCAVFMYYYLDVGNSQAAHGRAPAVALGHKVANPESVVLSYQGDGDLASIGLAEIIQATSMGLPMTFIFVNNAIYGMTGGQMAPTTLSGQRTTTTPTGRGRITGEPMRMAEMVAQMDAPVYVERVALFDNKQRTRAKKAIKKALQLQVENKGLGFVEVLAECPTHLHLTPLETEQWVKESMVPVFPLGVKKDVEVEPWFDLGTPSFEPDDIVRVIGGAAEPPQQFSSGFPSHIHEDDIAIKFAGAGETARRPSRSSPPGPRSTRASTGPTSRATVRSHAAGPPTPTCTSPRRRFSHRHRRSRTYWWRSTRRASRSSDRRFSPAAS